jgi:hypothetical protein
LDKDHKFDYRVADDDDGSTSSQSDHDDIVLQHITLCASPVTGKQISIHDTNIHSYGSFQDIGTEAPEGNFLYARDYMGVDE